MKAARTVFDDMMDQKPQGMAFGSCHPPVMEDFQDKETLEVDWDGWRQAINDLETLMETTKRFKVDPDKFVNYRFHYADEDGGFWCVMEHGGIFDNVPHERTSHH